MSSDWEAGRWLGPWLGVCAAPLSHFPEGLLNQHLSLSGPEMLQVTSEVEVLSISAVWQWGNTGFSRLRVMLRSCCIVGAPSRAASGVGCRRAGTEEKGVIFK